MSESLRATLERLAQPGAEPNAAFDRLLADYARFHLVLAVLAVGILVAAAAFAVSAWRHARSAPASAGRRWTFERTTWSLAFLSAVGVVLIAGVLAAANLSTASDPSPGFRSSIPMIADRAPETDAGQEQQAFERWLQSGERAMPADVRSAVDERLSWQRPKAIVCAVLLGLVLFASARLWRSIVHRSRRPDHRWRVGELGRLAAALGALAVAFLLVLMVLGNTQASLAPVSMTLFFG